jgi:hypothetical protein
MTDEELRSLVRDAVARHLAGRGVESSPRPTAHPNPLHSLGQERAASGERESVAFHRYALPRGDDGDGSCLIEPAVRCNHCGYCQSHGY